MRWFVFILIYLAIDIYAFQALRTLSKNKWVRNSYFILSLMVLGSFLYYWWQPSQGSAWAGGRSYAFGFLLTFLVAKLMLVVFLFGEDIFRFFSGLYRKLKGENGRFLPSRRKFLSTLSLGVAAIPFWSLIYGMFQGKYNFQIKQHVLSFPDLPKAFDGYKIVHISDIHCGSFDDKEEVKRAVKMINAQEADVVFFTGDLVNNTADEMNDWMEVFGDIQAKEGVYSVFGNHDYGDYYNWPSRQAKADNLEQLKRVHKNLGWKLLLNEHTFLTRDKDRLAIVGVENWGKGGFIQKGDLDLAANGLTNKDFKIVLNHDPSYWNHKIKADPKNYQLTLSGHTHGMQFGVEIPGWFKWSPIQYEYKYWAGIYSEKNRYINVNRGFGYLGYPGRVGIWPEITVIEMRKA